jgi:hypothetical protein
MRALPVAGLAVLLLAPVAGGKQTNKPDLKLMASLDMEAPEQQPILVIHIVNQSGHLLRVFTGGKVRPGEFQPTASGHGLRSGSRWQWASGYSRACGPLAGA